MPAQLIHTPSLSSSSKRQKELSPHGSLELHPTKQLDIQSFTPLSEKCSKQSEASKMVEQSMHAPPEEPS
jgi:hypothetical protein